LALDTKTNKKDSFRGMTTILQAPREWESVETNVDKMLEHVSQNYLLKDPFIKQYSGKTRDKDFARRQNRTSKSF
jgi:hypothetical protein